MAAALSSRLPVKAASWDTERRLPYNPHRTYPKKPQNSIVHSTTDAIPILTLTASPNPISRSVLPSQKNHNPSQGESGERYLGHDVWLPAPPKVGKPRSIYNAASLAYIGDCIYELYARRHFLFPPLNIEEYNDRVTAVVRCEAQDAMLQKLLNENFFSEEERDIIRWGKNIGSAKSRTKKRAGAAVYNRASSLETLIGHLYLTNAPRLGEIMLKLGFHCGATSN